MGDVVPVVPTERGLRWAILPVQARVTAVRLLVERLGLEAAAVLEMLPEVLRTADHPSGPDVDAAIERAFDLEVRAPLAETFRQFGEVLAPLFGSLRAAAEGFAAVARASGLADVAPPEPLAGCHCLCGQHWDRPGVCEGLVPESEIVPYRLEGGHTIAVCAPCADARRACAGRASGRR